MYAKYKYKIKITTLTMSLILDNLDIEILSIVTLDPLNLVKLSNKIGVPRETVRRRIRKLKNYIKFYALPDYYALGLSLIFVETCSLEKREFEKIDSEYLTSIIPFYTFKGKLFLLTYYFPTNHIDKLRKFLHKSLKEVKIYEGFNFLRRPDFRKYYDVDKKCWNINWDKIFEEILVGEKRAGYYFSPPKKLDEKDLYIINELRKDAITSVSRIARKYGYNIRTMLYHFNHHVYPNQILGFTLSLRYNKFPEYLLYLLKVEFSSMDHLTKFVGVFREIPLVTAIAGLARGLYIYLTLLLPHEMILNFYKFLDKAIKNKIIKRIEFAGIIDSEKVERREFPHSPKVFDKTWKVEKMIG